MSETTFANRDLDLRSLEGAEPIIQILRELDTLKPEEQLNIRLQNIPFQLYDLVQQRGFCIEYHRSAGEVSGIIKRRLPAP